MRGCCRKPTCCSSTCGAAGCSSTCCKATAPIVLNPYEIARICKATGLSYEDLLDVLDTDRAKGFPLVMLPRDPACHFWTATGCRIYEARPLACRLFPLGRVFENGRSHIVLPEVNRCSGLVPAPSKNGYSLSSRTGYGSVRRDGRPLDRIRVRLSSNCRFRTRRSLRWLSICWSTVLIRRPTPARWTKRISLRRGSCCGSRPPRNSFPGF